MYAQEKPKIKARIQEGGILRLDDVHPHWRFTKPASSMTRQHVIDDEPNIVLLLLVQDPAIARPKGRPRGPRELPTRAELIAERST